MNPAKINQQTVNGNRELESVLKSMAMSAGVPFVSGNVYYVLPSTSAAADQFSKYYDSTYEDGSSVVHSTLSSAYTAAVASRGDVILVAPLYTETVTAVKTLSKIGVSIIGLGAGLQRPALTGNAAIDVLSLTGANQLLQNISFPAPETTLQTADINVAAAGCVIRDTYHIGSKTSKYKVDLITVASGGDDLLVERIRGFNTVVITTTSFLSLEAAVARFEMRDSYIAGEFATGVLMDEATATLAYIHHNTFKNVTAAVAVVTFTTGNSTGVFSDNRVSGRHTTFATNIVEGTGMDFFENYVVEEPALSGIIHPAVDAD